VTLLLVEDDFDLSDALGRILVRTGYEVMCCADGAEALALMRKRPFDLAVLDLSLPGLDGIDVLRRLRDGANRTPVLVVTARGAVDERVVGLNAGADDYLVKPFDVDELIARVQALTRRVGRDGVLRCGQLRHEAASGAFYCGASPLDLSPREGALLKTLMGAVDRAVRTETLRAAVFNGNESVQADAIGVLVHRLRKKLEGTRVEIVTLRGLGYLLCDEAGSPSALQRRGG
jgi:DNA-binding response OmpR family regulator